MQRRQLILLCLFMPGCLQLDFVAHNARHCTVIGQDTCEDIDEDFDKLCTPCDEPYDWSKTSSWPQGFLAQDQMIRTPQDITQHTIPTRDGAGELDLYVLEPHGENVERAEITLVVQHGNFAGVEHYIPRMRVLHDMGYRVIVWDYRGYGKSLPDTTPTPDEFIDDAKLVSDMLPELTRGSTKTFLYAMSLGAIPSVEMALHRPPCGMVMEVPFTSLAEVTKTNTGTSLGGGFLSEGKFENTEKIKDYTQPLLVFAASKDNLFPVESVQRLYDNAASKDKTLHIIEGARHGIGDGVVETAGYAEFDAYLSAFITSVECD